MAQYGRLDLQQALINASKSMIRVKDPIILLRLITRFIDRQIGATHVAVLLYDKEKGAYVLIDSKGGSGQRIPIGYIRCKIESPIIRYFRQQDGPRTGKFHRKEALVYDELEHIRNFEIHVNRRESNAIEFNKIKQQMDMLRASICVPSYFKNNLVAVLILGERLDGRKYLEDEIGVFSTLANDVAMAVTNAELIKDLKKSFEREHELLMDTASALASAIDARDRYTKGHSERVAYYTMVIVKELVARRLLPDSKEMLEAARLAGLLHDVGKIGIKDQILNKPEKLTDEEYTVMKTHVVTGVRILSPIRGMREITDGAKFHHERWDGRGYPYGKKGLETPAFGRVIAVVDAFDTMITARPYQKARTREEAFAELERCSGTQFDPQIVEVFYDAWRNGKIRKQDAEPQTFKTESGKLEGKI